MLTNGRDGEPLSVPKSGLDPRARSLTSGSLDASTAAARAADLMRKGMRVRRRGCGGGWDERERGGDGGKRRDWELRKKVVELVGKRVRRVGVRKGFSPLLLLLHRSAGSNTRE